MRPEVSTEERRVGSLRGDAAVRALGPDRPKEQLAPLARVDGDAAGRAVGGRCLEKVPGKLGGVERGSPESIVDAKGFNDAIRTVDRASGTTVCAAATDAGT